MEALDVSSKLLAKALATLQSSFSVLEEAKATESPTLVLAAQDSIIQRFEYSYDSFWKFFKRYLEKNHKILDVNSPKSVFRMLVKKQLCTEEQAEILIKMADHRNATTHSYSIEQVRAILPYIPNYYACMQNIFTQVKSWQ